VERIHFSTSLFPGRVCERPASLSRSEEKDIHIFGEGMAA
jgi:hypothetical protein